MEHGAKREKDDVFSHKFIPALLLFALRPMRFANFHRITLSARAKTLGGTTSILDFGLRILDYHSSDDSICSGDTFGGITKPICFAVLRFSANSNLLGCWTGSSAGWAPLRILLT
jgi:hypothetical protein